MLRQICGIQHFTFVENEECLLEYLYNIPFFHVNFASKKIL